MGLAHQTVQRALAARLSLRPTDLDEQQDYTLKILPKKPSGKERTFKAARGLTEVYRAAGLPEVSSPEALPAGEQRRKSKGYVREIYHPVKKAGSTRTPPHAKFGRPARRPR